MPATTSQADVGRIERIALKHAGVAFRSQEFIDASWARLHYHSPPLFESALDEYAQFAEIISAHAAEIVWLPADDSVGIDAIYCRDAAVVCDRGIILCNMGKAARSPEPAALAGSSRAWGIPLLGGISGPGKLEGGDVAWLSPRIAAVGRGYRTNDEGIRQLRQLLGDDIDELIVVQLPHYKGADDVFHLMSILSPLDTNRLLTYSALMPVIFREKLLDLGFVLVEVADSEFETMGCNVLSLGDARCLMVEGNPLTRRRIEAAGIEVITYRGSEISRKGEGGPTCLTRPLLRHYEDGSRKRPG